LRNEISSNLPSIPIANEGLEKSTRKKNSGRVKGIHEISTT
jgi:hypothetical protein